MLRRVLDRLYQAAGVGAALALIAIFLLILAQIVARQLHRHIPSSGDLIGFCVVWAAFLGLAYAMRHEAHIRVELFVARMSRRQRQRLDVAVGLAAAGILAVVSWFVIALVFESWQYGDVTDGEIPLPLWLMQLPMAIGMVLFTLSMLDYALGRLFGKTHVPH